MEKIEVSFKELAESYDAKFEQMKFNEFDKTKEY